MSCPECVLADHAGMSGNPDRCTCDELTSGALLPWGDPDTVTHLLATWAAAVFAEPEPRDASV